MLYPERITERNPAFWNGNHAELKRVTLEAVIDHAGDTGTLNLRQCKACLKRVHNQFNDHRPGGLHYTQHAIVCRALEKINQTGLIRCAVPPAPLKAVRPSVLPDDERQWEAQDVALAYLRDSARALAKPKTTEAAALGLVYGLVQVGYGLEPAIGIVCRLRQGDLEPKHGQSLRTPVHFLETGAYVHETVPPQWLRERLQCVASFNRRQKLVAGRHPDQQWAIHLPEPEPAPAPATEQKHYQRRFDQLKKQLTDDHAERFSAWAAHQSQPVNTLMRRLVYFSRALRLTALGRGMEPAIYRQLEALPLPADAPAGLAGFLAPSTAIGHEPVNRVAAITSDQQRAPWAALSNLAGTALPSVDLCETVSADWARDARFLLRAFLSDLQNDFEKGKVAVSRQNTLKQLITRYLGQADRIAPRTSAAYLALLWIGTKLHRREIAVSTAQDYLNAIVIRGVLDYEGAHDLTNWDDEDVENVRSLVMNRRNLSNSTRMNRQDRLGQFLSFCQANGLLEEANLAKEKISYAMTKRRNHVLGLRRFDELQYTITQSAAKEAELVNTFFTLGFYGGLRSGEMLALTLDDIQVCGPEIYVRVRRGKTPAARRKIPLHLIAPPRVCEQFLAYLHTRLAVARKQRAKPKKMAFIGPAGCVEGFAREDIIPAVIGLLRYYVGREYDMHSLRHGFGTWLMLRAYTLKHPELKGQLLEQQHAVFSQEGEQRLTELFQWSEDEPLIKGRIAMFIHVRKVMGHSHIGVLMQNYLHAFGVIHHVLMGRM